MNHYSVVKYIFIFVVVCLGALYSLPNFYGEEMAVQISPIKSASITGSALQQKVEKILADDSLMIRGIISDANGLRVKVADSDTQLKVKDSLQKVLGNDYSVALNLISTTPDWLHHIGGLPMYLGLDLRGGVHFMMQVDMDSALNKQLDRRTGDIRSILREAKIPVAGVARDANKLIAKFRDNDTKVQAFDELRKNIHDMDVLSLEENRLSLTPTPEMIKKFQDGALQQNILTLRNRINELGVAEPLIQQLGTDRVVVELPGVQDTAKAKDILGRTASLEVRMVDEDHSDRASIEAALRGLIPPGDDIFPNGRDGYPLLLKKAIILTGENISSASAGFDNQNGEANVNISLDTRGAKIFAKITRDNIDKRMAIVLLEKGKGEIVTAPVIRGEITGGQVSISGHMSTKDANDIALLLRAGALAAPMEIIEERTIGPSLGKDNITKGIHSVLWGFVAIAIFMCIYYRLMGGFSTIALGTNVLFLVALLSLMQATLTLPGIAAIALTVGMAIDANVLINERIREELKNGQSPQAAIHAGYDRAFATILDSNITNFIAGTVLFAFGTGPVRGFAVVLCLGILTSMFSAILVSRALVNYIYGRQRRLLKISI
jgi:preprotein translocase subunit SecD